jgi:two-component system, NarL family, response regulator NreC
MAASLLIRLGVRILIRLMVISDEVIARRGLELLLASESEFEIVAAMGTDDPVRRASELKPNIVVVFAGALGSSCTQLIASLRIAAPTAGIVVMERDTDHVRASSLIAAGASGYVLHRTSTKELLDAIRTVACGRRYVDPELGCALFDFLARESQSGTKILSRREQEVLRLLAFGHTLKAIASTLNINPKSIETYRARIRIKTGLQTRADMVQYARDIGMFETEHKWAS